MKESKWTLISTVVLSLSIIFGSIYLGNSLKSNRIPEDAIKEEKVNSILISKEEAAEYLNMSLEAFNKLLQEEASEKTQSQVYDPDRFIAYVVLDTNWYYNKEQIDRWIVYHLYNKP